MNTVRTLIFSYLGLCLDRREKEERKTECASERVRERVREKKRECGILCSDRERGWRKAEIGLEREPDKGNKRKKERIRENDLFTRQYFSSKESRRSRQRNT